jgi:lipopolysaccharide export system permease protein
VLRILDRYLTLEFLKILVFSTLASISVSIIIDVIERIDTFLDNDAAFADVLMYYVYNIPYTTVLTLPAATLIATIFTVGQAERYNELTAMKACGISLYRIFAPLLAAGCLLSVAAFMFGEYVVPESNMLRDELYESSIVKHTTGERGTKQDIHFKGDGGTLYSIDTYDIAAERMKGVVIHRKEEDGKLTSRMDAEQGSWDGTRWSFEKGYLRYFRKDMDDYTVRFDGLVTQHLREEPEDFEERQRKPHEMGYEELGKYIERMERTGRDTHKDRVQRAFKISFPVANLIIVLFGASLASNTRAGGAAVGLGLSLLIFILFWGLTHVGKALGENGVLPTDIAAWLPNVIFCGGGFLLLVKARK